MYYMIGRCKCVTCSIISILTKESKPALHTDEKRVYMLKDEGLSPYPIYLNHPSMIGVGTNGISIQDSKKSLKDL